MMNCSVLLVDDTPQLLTTCSEFLQEKGCSLTQACDCKGALQALAQKPFHLIIADLKLTHSNGSNVVQKARAINPDAMVLLMTEPHNVDLSLSSLLSEADDYVLKPCDNKDLRLRLVSCLRRIEQKGKRTESEEHVRALNEMILNTLMVMSHDLRSPLISMSATIKLLIRGVYGSMDDSVRNTLTDLGGRVVKLIGIAEDCLNKASVMKDEMEDQRSILDLREDIIDPILEELGPELEEHNVSIDNRLGAIPANRILIKADKVWLKIVFRNLFRNAVKHGGRGTRIAFGFEKHDDSYRLNVYNSGPPIPKEVRDRLFTRFCRMNGDGQKEGEGMGMGLYLLKSLIQKHGGDIWYEAKEDGSNFVFTLPSY